MPFQVGERIGDYQVIDVLGAGGMGQVYKVRNVISDRVEAMKVLLPNLESDPELADRFMREIKVQASLDHPNIAALHTAQRVGNQLVMVMEFVEGHTIESMLRNGPLPLANTVNYMSQVLSALAYAHSHGIIHRDIKPANMMLTPNGTIKLMDFGIARIAKDPKLTATGRTVGSLYYMSPEQINGSTVDGRSDLYSLGVTLYEMATGRRPFQGDSDYSIMSAHLLQNPVPPIQIDPRVPDILNEIILMAIAKDPSRRFQSADAFRAALASVGTGLGVAPAAAAAVAPLAGPSPSTPSPSGAITAPLPAAQPVVVPPPPQQAWQPQPQAAAPAAAPQAVAPGAAPASSGRRGLYMAVGSLATVAVLVLAAVEGPKLFKPSGAAPQAAPLSSPVTPQATPEEPKPSALTPDVQAQQPATSPVNPQSPAEATPQPVTRPNHSSAGQQLRPAQIVQQPVQNASQPAATPQVQQPAVQQPAAQVPPAVQPQAPRQDTANQAEIGELREQLMLLQTRASSAKRTIQTMQAEQNRSGFGLRQDITTAMDRMDAYLGESEASLRAGDAGKGKRYLSSAEREVEKLERFLGR